MTDSMSDHIRRAAGHRLEPEASTERLPMEDASMSRLIRNAAGLSEAQSEAGTNQEAHTETEPEGEPIREEDDKPRKQSRFSDLIRAKGTHK